MATRTRKGTHGGARYGIDWQGKKCTNLNIPEAYKPVLKAIAAHLNRWDNDDLIAQYSIGCEVSSDITADKITIIIKKDQ